MSTIGLQPWEMGEEIKSTGFPPLIVSDQLLVRIAPIKRTNDIRDGLVASFIMTAYYDEGGNKIDTVVAEESADGYSISFPKGKRGLMSTKFRGPTNYYRFKHPESKDWYQIPQEKFTPEYAIQYLSGKITGWDGLEDTEKERLISEYLEDMYMYGLSQDLMLAIKGEEFDAPFVGLRTKLYRVWTAPNPAKGEKWPNIIATKWHKGQPDLDGEYETVDEGLTQAILEEWSTKDDATADFDPTKFVEDDPI